MSEPLHNPLVSCNSDTTYEEPKLLIVILPTTTHTFPWDEISQGLLNTLLDAGWQCRRCFAGLRVKSPFIAEA